MYSKAEQTSYSSWQQCIGGASLEKSLCLFGLPFLFQRMEIIGELNKASGINQTLTFQNH